MGTKELAKKLLDEGKIDSKEFELLNSQQGENPGGFKGIILLMVFAAGFLGAFLTRPPEKVPPKERMVEIPATPKTATLPPKDLTHNPIRIIRFTPLGQIENGQPIHITFDGLMVQPEDLNKVIKNLPIVIEPDLNPLFIWVKNNELKITFQKSLAPATNYQISIQEGFKSLNGVPIEKTEDFHFLFKPLKVNSFYLNDSNSTQIRMSLSLSSPVLGDSLEKYAVITGSKGTTFPFKIENTQKSSTHHIFLLDQKSWKGEQVGLQLNPGLKVSVGNQVLEFPIIKNYGTIEGLMVQNAYVQSEGKDPILKFSFNRKIFGVEEWSDSFISDPKIGLQISKSGWSEVSLSSPELKFGQKIKITLNKGLKNGPFELPDDYTHTFQIPDAEPQLFWDEKRVIQTPKGDKNLPLEAMNIPELSVTVYQIFDNNLIYFANNFEYSSNNFDLFYQLSQNTIPLKGEKNKLEKFNLPLKTLYGNNWEGAKLLKITGKNSYRTLNKLHILSNIGISAKFLSTHGNLIITGIDTGKPLSGVEILIYSKSNQILTRGMSDKNGLVLINYTQDNRGEPSVIVARKDKDINYLVLEKGHLPVTHFDVAGDPLLKVSEVEAYFFGEREIYQPGEEMHLSLYLRDGRHQQVQRPLTVKPVRPDGKKLKEISLTPDEAGESHFSLPGHLTKITGNYLFEIFETGAQKKIGQGTIQVEDVVPDRLEAKVSCETPSAKNGETLTFQVEGKYLAGNPAEGLKASGRMTLLPIPFKPAQWPDYKFGDESRQFEPKFEELGEIDLDKLGLGSFEISIPDKIHPQQGLQCLFSGTVKDPVARPVTAQMRVPVHPFPFYLGLFKEGGNQSRVKENEETSFTLKAVLPDGNLFQEPLKLQAKFYRNEWDYTLRSEEDGNYRYHYSRKEVLVKKQDIEIESGEATFPFTPQDWGEYVCRVEDSQGGSSVSLKFFTSWMDESARPETDFEKIDLTSSTSTAQPGETIKVTYKAPYTGWACFYVDHQETRFLKWVQLTEKEGEFEFTLLEHEFPTAYFNMILFPGSTKIGARSFRAMGLLPIKVKKPEFLSSILLDLPEKLTPGPLEVKATVLSPKKGPLNGWLTVSVVDKGFLQLSPLSFLSPEDHFFRKRGYFFKHSDLFSFVLGEEKSKGGKVLTPSGGFADEVFERHAPPVTIKRERPVSFYLTQVKIENGKGSFPLNLPEFSGKLRFRTWFNHVGGTGFNQEDRLLQQPVVLETLTPRVTAPNDQFPLLISLWNNQDFEETFTLEFLNLSGLKIENSNLTLTLKPGEKSQLKTQITIEGNELGKNSAQFQLQLKGEKFSSLTPFNIPILPMSPRIARTDFAMIPAGSKRDFDYIPEFEKGTEQQNFVFSPMPDLQLLSGLKYVIGYPYGCLEQTTSKSFPQLFAGKLLDLIEGNENHQELARRNVEFGIKKIVRMVTSDGGFSLWEGGEASYPYGTVYAAHFLMEAKKVGFSIPKETEEGLKSYLNRLLSDSTSPVLRSMALYVLSLDGEFHNELAEKWVNEKEGEGHFYLMAALARAGKDSALKNFKFRELAGRAFEKKRTTSGTLDSPVKLTALALNCLVDSQREEDLQSYLVSSLLKMGTYSGHWGTTHDNAMSIVALGKYFNRKEIENPTGLKSSQKVKGELSSDKGMVFSFDLDKKSKNFTPESHIPQFTLSNQGPGDLFINLTELGVPLPSKIVPFEKGVRMTHQWLNTAGEPLENPENPQFKAGELYIFENQIEADHPQSNMFLEIRFPGGFEVENASLATRDSDLPAIKENTLPLDFKDLLSERAAYFFNIPKGKQNYIHRILVRAVLPGQYHFPAITAGAMYNPEVQSLKTQSSTKID